MHTCTYTCVYTYMCIYAYTHTRRSCLLTKLWPTLCDPMGCSPPGFYVHGIFQARVLEWAAIAFPGNIDYELSNRERTVA